MSGNTSKLSFLNNSLNRFLTARIVLFSTCVTVFVTLFQLYADYRTDFQQITKEQDNIIKSYFEPLSFNVWIIDETLIKNQINGIASLPDISYVQVTTNSGESWHQGVRLKKQVLTRITELKHAYINNKSLVIGKLIIQSDLANIYKRLLSKALLILLSNGFKTFIVAFFIMYLVNKMVSKPLNEMTMFFKTIRLGDSSANLKISRNDNYPDEVQQTANAVNAMCTQLADSYEKLRKSENELSAALTEKEQLLQTSEIVIKERSQLRKYLSNIINSMPSLLIGVDANGNVTQWNRTTEQSTGIAVDEALGKQLSVLMPSIEYEMDEIYQSVKTRVIKKKLNKSRQVNNSTIYENITVYPLITNGVEGAVIRIDDVTKEYLLEEQLHQSRKMDAIGQLAGGIAHDFNNVLAGINGAADVLKSPKRKIDKKGIEFVDLIIQSVSRASDLTDKLLAFGRKGNRHYAAINVHQLLDDTISILKRTIDKRITISAQKDATQFTVLGDATDLQNAFLNLGINASHAIKDEGKIQISTQTVILDESLCTESPFDIEPGEYVKINIHDTGHGIPTEHLQKIFEPFFTTKKQGKGTGLGLAATYGAIRAHHGSITVQSKLGTGTDFDIHLPCSTQTVLKEGGEKQNIQGSGQILLVDDEQLLRITGKQLLEELGYEVLVAANGIEAVDKFKEKYQDIDVVITDMIMPKMNGRDAFFKMKEIDDKCKVIISSGFTNDAKISDLKEKGLAGFIQKPFNTYDLGVLLKKILN